MSNLAVDAKTLKDQVTSEIEFTDEYGFDYEIAQAAADAGKRPAVTAVFSRLHRTARIQYFKTKLFSKKWAHWWKKSIRWT